jgi:tRNA A37 threonylcarbamoyladenosine synthetase subunit TsaC/SUA5/YrdC
LDVTVIKYGNQALVEIKRHLNEGQPVVLPNPSPLPYVVVAVSPVIINSVKRRSIDKNVASFIGRFDTIKQYFDLDQSGMKIAEKCLVEKQMTVLCPVKNDIEVPTFLLPSLSNNHVLLFAAHLAGLQQLCLQFPSLYVSSGNVTSMEPKQFCTDVEAQFQEFGNPEFRLLLVDGDHLRDKHRRHGSTTMVMVSQTGELSVKRNGIQDLHLDKS